VFAHLELLLLELEEVAALDVEFALVDGLEVLHGRYVILLHLVHGLLVLVILELLLPAQVLISLLQVLYIKIFLSLDLLLLPLVLLLGLAQFELDLALVDIQLVVQLLLLPPPLLHLLLAD